MTAPSEARFSTTDRAAMQRQADRRNVSGLLLAYVDESYSPDWFTLGAVIGDAAAVRRIEVGFDALVARYRGQFDLDAGTELHGYPMFQGAGVWRRVPLRARINLYAGAMRVVGDSGARVILRGIDVARQRVRYVHPHPPHEVALAHMLERIDSSADARRAHALVLADEVHNSERHRTNFRDFRTDGTPGYRSSTLPRLLDTIHFAPSHHSRLLQAADLVTFLYRRRSAHVESDERARAANDLIWSHVEPAVEHEHCWRP
ncbi:DUF3800 domain-containing protein [Cellulomonas sp. PS-H5]|uniref:DUF3800 domain-containing protein n=1 Tax=Cellulomonas sp. PS-H5 TaxID=2820400 RepID=UPI001C4F214F|nr:DUF3800 domain-containing protein [Cellulomonas sp. PS-H5]MBW0254854.1 DUF3800 domain-containing protein [Cellulomonas sp. PS-H5]